MPTASSSLPRLARTLPFLHGVWWYDFQDDGVNPDRTQDNFGLVRTDLTPKPGFVALSAVTRWINEAESFSRAKTADPVVIGTKFRIADGQEAMTIWTQGSVSRRVRINGVSAIQKLRDRSPIPVAGLSGPLDTELTDAPIFVTGTKLDFH